MIVDKVARKSIFSGIIFILIALVLNFFKPTFLIYFIILFVIERIYESYFLTQKSTSLNIQLDIYGRRVIVAFTVMVLSGILELNLSEKKIVEKWAFIGFAIWFIGLIVRFWSIISMEKEWCINTFSVPNHVNRKAPYSLLRHPYYFGVLIESVAYPITLNAWFTLIYSCFVVIPLEAYRIFIEEKNLVKNLGWNYIKYKREVNRLIPTFKKRKCYERRSGDEKILMSHRKEKERRKSEMRIKYDRRKMV